jgi:hypothetical protein
MADCGHYLEYVLEHALPDLPAKAVAQVRDVTARASAWGGTLASAQSDLRDGVGVRQLRRYLAPLEVHALEGVVNDALWMQSRRRLPRRCIVAIDLTLIPYHGKAFMDEAELRRCKALGGTTWFHAFATLNVVMRGKRYTLAVTFVEKRETNGSGSGPPPGKRPRTWPAYHVPTGRQRLLHQGLHPSPSTARSCLRNSARLARSRRQESAARSAQLGLDGVGHHARCGGAGLRLRGRCSAGCPHLCP